MTRQKVELFLELNEAYGFFEKPAQCPIDDYNYIIPKQYIIEWLNLDTRPLNMIMMHITKGNEVFLKKTLFLTEKLTITEDEERKLIYLYEGNIMQEKDFIRYVKLIHFK